jgi:chromosome segregation ATPase
MRILNFLSSIAPVLVCLAAPEEGSGGFSSSELKSESPKGDTLEARYASAQTIISDYFKQLSGAMRERDEAVGQVAGLKARAEKAEKDLLEANGKVTALTSDLSTMTGDRDSQKSAREKAESRVTLIESFCKHSNVDLAGLDKFKAAKSVEGLQPGGSADEGKAHYDKWQALKKIDSRKAAAYKKQHNAAIKEYVESTEE